MPHFRGIKKDQVPPPPIPQDYGEYESFKLEGMSGPGHEEDKNVLITGGFL